MKASFLLFSISLFFTLRRKVFGINRIFISEISSIPLSLSLRINFNNRLIKKRCFTVNIRLRKILPLIFDREQGKSKNRHVCTPPIVTIPALFSSKNIIQLTRDNTRDNTKDASFNTLKTMAKSYPFIIFFMAQKRSSKKEYSSLPTMIIEKDISFPLLTVITLAKISIKVRYKKISDNIVYNFLEKLCDNNKQRECVIVNIIWLSKKIAIFLFWTVRQGLRYFGGYSSQVLGIAA